MFGLLSWLWDRANRVYEFFGWLYSTARNVVLNAYDWARRAASDAYTWARNYAYSLYIEARVFVLQQFNYAYYTILGYYDRAISYVTQKYNDAVAWARGQIDAVSVAWYKFVNGIKSEIIYLYSSALGQLETWVRAQLGIQQAQITPLSKLDEAARPIVSVLGPANLSRLADFLSNGYNWLSSFLESPIAVLWGIIEPYLSDLASYWLGYAMGAVNTTLPAAPNLGSSGGYGPGPGGQGPGPGAGKLAPPLSVLRVSGNTFNNPPGHMGIDFGLSNGTTVYAAHSGTVEIAQDVGNGYANCVTIRGGDWWTRYAHLMGFYVKPGDIVSARQPIAQGDNTGHSTGPHLHFEVKYKGSFVDPVSVL